MNTQHENLLSDEDLALLYSALMSDEEVRLNSKAKKFVAQLIDDRYPHVRQAYLDWKTKVASMQTRIPRSDLSGLPAAVWVILIFVLGSIALVVIDMFFSVEDILSIFR